METTKMSKEDTLRTLSRIIRDSRRELWAAVLMFLIFSGVWVQGVLVPLGFLSGLLIIVGGIGLIVSIRNIVVGALDISAYKSIRRINSAPDIFANEDQ